MQHSHKRDLSTLGILSALCWLCSCGDEKDHDTAGCVPVAEVPYDGIDQDCDGVDLTDVDGDGYDAEQAAGTDCADDDPSVNPAEADIPYDGIDQDCSGSDLTDVDGDGYDAEDVGGPDCNDQDSTAYPGGTEVAGDGADNDCDGYVDEVEVCWDGSGAYDTIQAAVDGSPDGRADFGWERNHHRNVPGS